MTVSKTAAVSVKTPRIKIPRPARKPQAATESPALHLGELSDLLGY